MAGELQRIAELGSQLRVDSIRCTTAAESGHPTSSMSAADLMAVLLAKYLKYDWDDPGNPNNDRLIFSKGHASPLLYAMYKAAGVITDEELLSLRKFGSRLEGHPKPLQSAGDHGAPRGLPWVDVATGSLGQGLPIGVGMALSGKYVDKLPFHVWVLLGDSELAEGSVWEAFDKAGHYKLSNVIAILDMNRLGQRGPTELGWDAPVYAARARAFGWHAIEIDGHDIAAIDAAYGEALAQTEKPTCVVAKTVKGSGVSLVANKEGWHGKALSPDQAKEAIKELGGERHITVPVAKPAPLQPATPPAAQPLKLPVYEVGTEEATRKAFGDALVAVGANRPDVVVLDGEVGNSTFTEEFNKAYPGRFFEMYIAEQQLVCAAIGLGVLRKIAFAATFAAFLTRAFDQIRMAAVSNAEHSPMRIACRREHRRGRAVADGSGRPGDDAGRSRQHRAVPVRCQPDGAPGGRHGRSTRHHLPANDSREDAGHLCSGRDVSHRWEQGGAALGCGSGGDHRRGDHLAREPPRLRTAQVRRHPGAGH